MQGTKSNGAGGHLSLTFPKIPPHKIVKEYFASKHEVEKLTFPVCWDFARDSPLYYSILARRRQHNCEIALKNKRREAVDRTMKMDKQWILLRSMEEKFHETFLKFNQFVRENDEKRIRSKARYEYFQQLNNQRAGDMIKLDNNYKKLNEFKTIMDYYICKYKIYENYLSDVIRYDKEFKSVGEIINKFEALHETKLMLAERQRKLEDETLACKGELNVFLSDRKLLMVGLQTKVAVLAVRYKQAQLHAWTMENLITNIQDETVRRTNEIQQVKWSIWDLYEEMCKRREENLTFEVNDIKNQLILVSQTLGKMREALNLLNDAKDTRRTSETKSPASKSSVHSLNDFKVAKKISDIRSHESKSSVNT